MEREKLLETSHHDTENKNNYYGSNAQCFKSTSYFVVKITICTVPFKQILLVKARRACSFFKHQISAALKGQPTVGPAMAKRKKRQYQTHLDASWFQTLHKKVPNYPHHHFANKSCVSSRIDIEVADILFAGFSSQVSKIKLRHGISDIIRTIRALKEVRKQ